MSASCLISKTSRNRAKTGKENDKDINSIEKRDFGIKINKEDKESL
jgi:hypothetical protein